MIVYWIKRKEMVNPYTEGYIGVTNLSIQERFEQHSKNVYKKSMAGRKWFYDPVTFKSKRLHIQPEGWIPGRFSR